MTLTLNRVLMIVACVLFVVAALAAGGVLTGLSMWAFGFGGFAAWGARARGLGGPECLA